MEAITVALARCLEEASLFTTALGADNSVVGKEASDRCWTHKAKGPQEVSLEMTVKQQQCQQELG